MALACADNVPPTLLPTLAPGTRMASAAHERLPVGMASITSRVTTRRCTTFWMSTVGMPPSTVTSSSTAPGFISAFTFAVKADVSSRFSRLNVLKPGMSERHGVHAGPQVSDVVATLIVGDGDADLFDQGRTRRLDRHARDHQAARVANDAGDGAASLRKRLRRPYQ